jgi:HEAT repeat protein
MVQDSLKTFIAKISLDMLKDQFLKGKIADLDSFFKYLEFIGPRSTPLAVDLILETKDTVARAKALDFLLTIGKKDIPSLMKAVREDSPAIAQDIIDVLIRIEDPQAVEQFSAFLAFKNKDIRTAAIRALGRRGDAASNAILVKFMADPEEEVRYLAIDSLHYLGDRSFLDYFSKLALEKKFKKKNRKEKEVILNFLGRSREAEACAALEKILAKSSLFSRSKHRESRLLAISALENMRIPEAEEVLQKGTKIADKKIKHACRMALRKIAFGDVRQTDIKEELR